MAPVKKNALNFEFFHVHSFFFDVVVRGQFFTLLGPFLTLAGDKNSSKYVHIKLSPLFRPLTESLAQKPSLFSDFNEFYQLSFIFGYFCPFWSVFGPPPEPFVVSYICTRDLTSLFTLY